MAHLVEVEVDPTTGAFADYLLFEAADAPEVEIIHLESPTPLAPLGAKGTDEGGAILAPAAIISAVEDTLRAYHPRFTYHPLKPGLCPGAGRSRA